MGTPGQVAKEPKRSGRLESSHQRKESGAMRFTSEVLKTCELIIILIYVVHFQKLIKLFTKTINRAMLDKLLKKIVVDLLSFAQ